MGFDVGWNDATRQVTLELSALNHDVIIITLDSPTFSTNGMSHSLDVPAQVINGRTMLPLREILESVGNVLEWDANTNTVSIWSAWDFRDLGIVSIPFSWTYDTWRGVEAWGDWRGSLINIHAMWMSDEDINWMVRNSHSMNEITFNDGNIGHEFWFDDGITWVNGNMTLFASWDDGGNENIFIDNLNMADWVARTLRR